MASTTETFGQQITRLTKLNQLSLELMVAIQVQNIKEITELLDAEPTLVNRKHEKSLPLISAIHQELYPVRFTLSDSVLKDPSGVPDEPIFTEVDSEKQKRDGSITKLFLERGADVNQFDDNDVSPLMQITNCCVLQTVAEQGKSNPLLMTLLKLLVEEYQADVNLENRIHHTAVFAAIVSENSAVIEYLFKHGANFKFISRCDDDEIPANGAGMMKHFIENGVVEYMTEGQLNHCFKQMIKEDGLSERLREPNCELIQSFVEQCVRYNRLREGFYPVHHLLQKVILTNKEYDLIEFLMGAGFPIDAVNEQGMSWITMSFEHQYFLARFAPLLYLFMIESNDPSLLPQYFSYVEKPYNINFYLNVRCVRNYNTLLHASCESNLTKAKIILDKVATLPLQGRIKILTAQNAEKQTPLDILHKQLETLTQRKATAALGKAKSAGLDQAMVAREATDEKVEVEVALEADAEEESKFAAESVETKVTKELHESQETEASLEAKELEIKAVITQMRNLMQNLVDKSVMSARQFMKFSFDETSPLHGLPEDLNAKIFQFLDVEPACILGTVPASQEFIESAIQKAYASPVILKMSGELWEINKEKALAEKNKLDKEKAKEADVSGDQEKDKKIDASGDQDKEEDGSRSGKIRRFE